MNNIIHKKGNTVRASIEFEKDIGYYLYIFDPNSKEITHDFIEDTLENAKQKAKEDFGLEIEEWIEN
ncbi:MAG: hypothetical protein MRY79_04025 [Alphaproteobacteria bacterium]|nr:hypothetical protein [Alphaproteobacteria bacterium]